MYMNFATLLSIQYLLMFYWSHLLHTHAINFTVYVHICNMYLIHFIVPPMNAPNLIEPTNLMNTSFTITWTITNPNNIRSYKITWTNLHSSDVDNIEVQGNTTIYTVIGLNGVHNYNVSVTAENECGMMESDPITVYGKDVLRIYIP